MSNLYELCNLRCLNRLPKAQKNGEDYLHRFFMLSTGQALAILSQKYSAV